MGRWQEELRCDPILPLLSSENRAVQYFVEHDLLGKPAVPVQSLWQLPEAQKILKKQQAGGSWAPSGKKGPLAVNYHLVETWRQFRFLVDQFGLTREDSRLEWAAEFLFSCQTSDGDFRGFLANQYAPYYTGAIISLLIKAGYEDDPRIEKGLQWLLAMRQDDGGWTIPLLTHRLDRATMHRLTTHDAEPLEPDRSKPFSHNWTGMVLRAFAAHRKHRKSKAAGTAARLLASRFFQPDAYGSYRAASYWVKFEYPFWWNHLVAALDSVSLIGLSKDNEGVAKALRWLIDHQEKDGLWRVSYVNGTATSTDKANAGDRKRWVTLAICRVLRRLLERRRD